jgi:LPS sulfotransferase NodH
MPRISYLVCATERSGSSLLCELLGATGVAGRPGEPFEVRPATGRPRQPREYFEGVDDPTILDRLAPPLAPLPQPDWQTRLRAAVEQGTTSNGVFGAKMMWAYLHDFVAHGEPEEQLGPLEWVHIARVDKVRQAVSLWRAIQTSQWRAGDRDACVGEPVFHAGAIAHLKQRLEEHERGWAAWFAERGLSPLEVTYEELSADPAATVRRVLDHLGLPEVPIPAPPLDRQSDDLSRQWAERFREEVPGLRGR